METTVTFDNDTTSYALEVIFDPRMLPFYTPSSWLLGFRICLVLGSIVGTFGNIITIVAITTTKELQTKPNYYLVSLAFADLAACMFIMPMAIISYTIRIPTWLCQATGYLTTCLFDQSMFHLGIVAINRYILICHSRDLYDRVFSERNIAISIAVCWVVMFLQFSSPFYGFGLYGWNPFFGTCHFIGSKYTLLFIIIFADTMVIFPSYIITFTCYVLIFRKFMQSRRKIGQVQVKSSNTASTVSHGTNDENTVTKTEQKSDAEKKTNHVGAPEDNDDQRAKIAKSAKQQDMKRNFSVAKNLFVVWVAFLLLWMPIVLTTKIDDFRSPYGIWYHFIWVCAAYNSTINFLIYGAMNRAFKNAYFRVLGLNKFIK